MKAQGQTRLQAAWRLAPMYVSLLIFSSGCSRKQEGVVPPDHVTAQDVTFYSTSLQRDVHYLVFVPKEPQQQPLPTVYLLHGAGADYLDWARSSNVGALAAAGYVLVMPEGHDSYDVNSVLAKKDRYEDFLAYDLLQQVESRFAVSHDARRRALVGVSMGGFGALTIAMHHPDLFAFIGAMSPPLDAPERPFVWKRLAQSWRLRRVFGPSGSAVRKEKDPFVILQTATPHRLPYIFLSCGSNEPLLAVNRRFARQLTIRQDVSTFQTPPGGHAWDQWNAELPSLLQSLREHVR